MLEDNLINFVFSNQFLSCGFFGALGGMVHSLDYKHQLKTRTVIAKIIVSMVAGFLLFFATYDVQMISPSTRIAISIVCGFYGSAIFRYLARFYLRQQSNTSVNTIDDLNDKVHGRCKNNYEDSP